MVGINSVNNLYNQFGFNKVKKTKAAEKTEAVEVKKTEAKKPESTENKLSDKAKDYLKKLREKYGDYDFVVADTKEDQDALAAASDKDISVMVSSEELEKMADDEEYGNKRLAQMEEAVEATKDLSENADLSKLTIELGDDGILKLFADLERIADKQYRQKTSIEATSVEELREKIQNLDWAQIPSEEIKAGDKIDYSA